MTIYDYVWSNNRWISADAVAKPLRGAEIAAHLTPGPPILSNAVAKPPRGDEIAANVPPDHSGMSFNEYLACLKYGDGVNGKYAADFNFPAFQIAIRKTIATQKARQAKLDAERAQLDAQWAKLVAESAGSSATTFTGQLAVAGHSGISPEGGGGCCVWLW